MAEEKGAGMKWPHRGDDPFDTWLEFYLAWIAIMLTLLVVGTVLYYIRGL